MCYGGMVNGDNVNNVIKMFCHLVDGEGAGRGTGGCVGAGIVGVPDVGRVGCDGGAAG